MHDIFFKRCTTAKKNGFAVFGTVMSVHVPLDEVIFALKMSTLHYCHAELDRVCRAHAGLRIALETCSNAHLQEVSMQMLANDLVAVVGGRTLARVTRDLLREHARPSLVTTV